MLELFRKQQIRSAKSLGLGLNPYGQLNDGPNHDAGEFSTFPHAAINETMSGQFGGVVSIAATSETCLVRKADDVVFARGANSSQ